MKIFLSGEYDVAVEHRLHRRLISFFYHPPRKGTLTPDKHTQSHFDWKHEIFIDSGAFSAFTRDAKIDRSQLTEFVIKHQEHIAHAAALDVIGDAEASYTNWQWQKAQGANVFPTFHFGEPFEFLDTLVKEAPLIGIGGVAQLGTGPQLYEWLDDVWQHVLDDNGKPKIQVHGFALTSVEVLKRYPWELCDSASWAYAGAMGKITIFQNGSLIPIAVTERNPDAEDIKSRHWIHLRDEEKAVLQKFADDEGLHIDVADCVHSRVARGIFNAASYMKLEALSPTRMGLRQRSLF